MKKTFRQKLKIAHLYPDFLNLYGDKGNILALTRRLEWRGLDFELENITIGEHNKKFSDFDLFFIGGGQDSQQSDVAKDLAIRKNELKAVIEFEKPLLAVCGGYQLLGKTYQTSEADEIEGLGILDVYTEAIKQENTDKQDRLVANVVAELLLPLSFESELKTLVGFENHSGRTRFSRQDSATKPLAKIIKGHGNNGEDGFEGAYYKNCIGTYLHGSLLPKNPHLADELILRALKCDELPSLNDEMEISTHKVLIGSRC